MMYGYGFPLMGGIIMMVVWVLLLIGIVWGAVYLVRNTGHSQATPHSESPLDMLKRRYAAGEINKEQFEEMKRTLGV